MTLHEILNASRNELYLTGKKAYIRRFGVVCKKTSKTDFAELLNGCNDVVVIVSKTTAPKYAKAINNEGFILQGRADYSSDEYALLYKDILA